MTEWVCAWQVLQFEMERLSLNKAAKSDKAAAARLAGLDQVSQDNTAILHFVEGVRFKLVVFAVLPFERRLHWMKGTPAGMPACLGK